MSADDDSTTSSGNSGGDGAARIIVETGWLIGTLPHAPDRTRLVTARLLIAKERSLGTTRSDDEICKQAGFSGGASEYWRDALAEPMREDSFVHMLAIHFASPSLEGSAPYYDADLREALLSAFKNAEPWFIEILGEERRLRPREAVAYLLSMPRRRHLVPPSLKAFLESQRLSATTSIPATETRRQSKRTEIKELMKKWLEQGHSPDELEKLKEKTLVVTFGGRDGGSREVYRKARNEVVAEVDRSRSTKSTIDS
jgi:hypothetical protein